MILKVKLKGTGTDADPYRCSLPYYSHLHGNIDQGFAFVSIPDHVHGLTPGDLESETVERTTEGDYYPKLSDANINKIHANFNQKYAAHKDKFKIELA